MTKEENERAKTWLKRGYNCRICMKGKIAIKEERLANAEYSGIKYDKTNNNNNCNNSTENKNISVLEIDEEIKNLEKEHRTIDLEIKEAIDSIDNYTVRSVMDLRFRAYKTVQQIAKETNYSESRINQLLKQGVSEVYNKLD